MLQHLPQCLWLLERGHLQFFLIKYNAAFTTSLARALYTETVESRWSLKTLQVAFYSDSIPLATLQNCWYGALPLVFLIIYTPVHHLFSFCALDKVCLGFFSLGCFQGCHCYHRTRTFSYLSSFPNCLQYIYLSFAHNCQTIFTGDLN